MPEGGSYFAVVDVERDVPLAEVRFGEGGGERAFSVHAALDTLDAARLVKPGRLFSMLERSPAGNIHAYICASGHRLVLLAGGLRSWGDDALGLFFADVSEALVRLALMSPFEVPVSSVEPAIRVLARRHLSLV